MQEHKPEGREGARGERLALHLPAPQDSRLKPQDSSLKPSAHDQRATSGLIPSGVSSESMSNHSGLNSRRIFSRMAMFVVSAITASPSATFGLQRG